jgi:hypothetical protein
MLREEHRLRVFENRVLRRIFGPNRDEVTGDWHAWERREMCTGFWWESQKERDHLEDRCVAGSMGSEWILGRLAEGGVRVDPVGSGYRPVAVSCKYGDEPAGSGVTGLLSYYEYTASVA